MFAGVERFAISKRLGHRIHRLDGVVAVNACLGGGRSLEPVTVVKSAIAKERTDFPAVNVLLSGLEILLDLGLAGFHSFNDGGLLLLRESSEVEFLSRFDAELGELRADLLFLRLGGRELEREGEAVKEAGLHHFLINLWEGECWCRGCGRLLRICREGLR